jgi:ribosomal protein S27AE
MVNIAAITTAVNGAAGVLKEIGSIAKKAGNREINERLIDLQQRVIDIQGMLAELIAENEVLRRQMTELEHSADIEKKLKLEESVYWTVQDGKRVDGPLCPNCWDSKKMIVHLTPSGARGGYHCGVCKAGGFHTAEYKSPSPQFIGVPRSSPLDWMK